MVEAKQIQELSATDANRLMGYLLCSRKGNIFAGNDACIEARSTYRIIPDDPGRDYNTIPQKNRVFARICELCPVLLTAYAQVFG